MKPIVYFDFNVFVNYLKNEETKIKLEDLKCKYLFYYAPPYLEEVANIGAEKTDFINEHIEKIDSLFEKRIFRPQKDGDIVKYSEPARDVYQRVVNLIGLSQLAYENDSLLFPLFKHERERNQFETKVISNFKYDKVFLESTVKEYIDYINKFRPVTCPELYVNPTDNKKYLNNHRQTEAVVNALFNVLESIGYRAENQTKRIRSRMHDVSHAIYATKSDVFVIEDGKFREKCKAVYSILGVETKIVSYKEFLYL